jgi:DNA invertase Pin-like site-specific DNA recombinase
MERAGILVRVSSDTQDEQLQIPDTDRWCEDRRYNVTQRYTLHDKSASKGKQQSTLDQILTHMRNGEIKVLVVWHSDRIDRREVWRALMFIAQVNEIGGRIESTQEGVLDENSLSTIINSHMNREKVVHLTQQVKLSHDQIRANGALHGRAPWGMTIDASRGKLNKQLVGTDQGRGWVPRIFGKVIAGWSLAKISVWLESEGIPGDHGPWHESTIGAMIRNPAYMGFRCEQDPGTKKYGKILHKCEALVTPEVWRQAQEALDTRPKRGYTNPDTRAMLAGVLKCGNPQCDATGAPDSPMNRSRSSTKLYYRCCGTGAVRKSCGTMVCLAQVDEAVNKIVNEIFNIPRKVRHIIPGTDHAAELQSLDFELQQLPAKRLDRRAEQAEREALWAEQDRIAALPVVDDEEVWVDTKETYADLWNALRPADRGPWLVANGFTVRASRAAVTLSQGTVSATMPLTSPERPASTARSLAGRQPVMPPAG